MELCDPIELESYTSESLSAGRRREALTGESQFTYVALLEYQIKFTLESWIKTVHHIDRRSERTRNERIPLRNRRSLARSIQIGS